MTTLILNLSLAVFSFSVKLGSFALALRARIVLHSVFVYFFFQENINANFMFAVCCERDSKSLLSAHEYSILLAAWLLVRPTSRQLRRTASSRCEYYNVKMIHSELYITYEGFFGA